MLFQVLSQHSFHFMQVSTTLVSMTDEDMLAKNLKAASNPLTEHEAKVRDYILHMYFGPVRVKHWEGVEVAQYRREMRKY